jgi:uncharacterized membrane protein AbrB (regulator of aidB expression)
MQYMRVVFVAVTASIVARLWVHVPAGTGTGVNWFPPIAWLPGPAISRFAAGLVGDE